ncbi:MAG TPA: cytochrome c [Polyangia bacterium]|nr:cytochrome c [Polyangia bacterium]
MSKSVSIAAFILGVVAAAGCEHDHPFKSSMKLGGQEVSADTLNRGRDAYQQYCRPCHGDNGDGKGYSSLGLRPPPRDFTQGLFKFGHTQIPNLPPDAELKQLVTKGLHGTAMLPWDIQDQELDAALQYIKTFSPKWQQEAPGKPIEVSADPFGEAKRAEAITLGEELYHAKAQCSGCHPAFVTHEKLFNITKKMNGTGQTDFSAEMYLAQLKDTEYCLEWKPGPPNQKLDDRECAKVVKQLPPNFTRDPLKTIYAGSELTDLYRTIASGIGGAAMPTWKGTLKEEELWGLVYYVKSLMDKRGTPAAKELADLLNAPANMSWQPPKAEPAPTEGTPPTGGKPAPAPAPKTEPAKKG